MRRKTLLLVSLLLFLGIGAWVRWYVSPDRIRTEEQSVAPVGDGAAYRRYWGKRIRSDGAAAAYAALKESLKDASEGTQEAGMYYFGVALYEQEGKEGLGICDEVFTFGCSRGYFAAAITKEGKGILPDLAVGCKKAFGAKFSSCLHGMGHGVLLALGNDRVEEALIACETAGANEEMGCSSGIFMEYNTHGRDEQDEDAPLEPCISLQEQFREACFYGQVRWWQEIYKHDFGKIIGWCEGLSKDARKGCFEGIGNTVPSFLDYDIARRGDIYARIRNTEDANMTRQSAGWITLFDTKNTTQAVAVCSAGDEAWKQLCTDGLKSSAFWE